MFSQFSPKSSVKWALLPSAIIIIDLIAVWSNDLLLQATPQGNCDSIDSWPVFWHLTSISKVSPKPVARPQNLGGRLYNTTKQPRGEGWKIHHESCWDHLVPFGLYTVSKIWIGPKKTPPFRGISMAELRYFMRGCETQEGVILDCPRTAFPVSSLKIYQDYNIKIMLRDHVNNILMCTYYGMAWPGRSIDTRENWHSSWKMVVGRLLSLWEGLF